MKPEATHARSVGLNLHAWAMAGILLALWALLSVLPQTRDTFPTEQNLLRMTMQVSHIVVIAVGMTLVIVIRGIDLSVGAGVALTGTVAALLQIDHGMPAWVAIAAALAAGASIGFWHGFWVARLGIPAFVVTLAGFEAYRGVALVASDARGLAPMREDFAVLNDYLPTSVTIALIVGGCAVGLWIIARDAIRRKRYGLVPPGMISLAARSIAAIAVAGFMLAIYARRGMPVPVLLAVSTVIFGVFLTKKTRFGRNVYAVGGNPEAARLSGINVRRTTIGVYVILGVLTAIGGLILAARTNAVTPGSTGDLLELKVITAVVIGGASFEGGRGSVVGALLGALVFITVANGMNMFGINSNWQKILMGLILMAAVLADVLLKGKRK